MAAGCGQKVQYVAIDDIPAGTALAFDYTTTEGAHFAVPFVDSATGRTVGA